MYFLLYKVVLPKMLKYTILLEKLAEERDTVTLLRVYKSRFSQQVNGRLFQSFIYFIMNSIIKECNQLIK